MSEISLEEFMQQDCETRYDYFLNLVAEEKTVWIVVNTANEFLKVYAEDEDFEYLPIWPTAEAAEHYCKADDQLTPKSIALPEFLKKWIPGLQRDQLEVGVFPADDGSVWVLDASELQRDIQDELSAF